MHPACGAIGFPASVSSSMFPSGKTVFTERRPPAFSCWFHPLMSLPPLQSSALRFLLGLLGRGFLPWGSPPASRCQRGASTPWPPRSMAHPPLAFLTPATVSSALRLVGLFHPTTTSRVSLQGFAPRLQPEMPFGTPFPLVVVVESLLTVARQRQSSTLRLQGFAPHTKSWLTAGV